MLSTSMINAIDNIKVKIAKMNEFELTLSATHGDYDFDNILFKGGTVGMVDFEHFEIKGFPLYDLAHLIYNPLIQLYKNNKVNKSFNDYIYENQLLKKINDWFYIYSKGTSIPLEIVKMSGALVALEQQAKDYPYYRDPETFPMYTDIALQNLFINFNCKH